MFQLAFCQQHYRRNRETYNRINTAVVDNNATAKTKWRQNSPQQLSPTTGCKHCVYLYETRKGPSNGVCKWTPICTISKWARSYTAILEWQNDVWDIFNNRYPWSKHNYRYLQKMACPKLQISLTAIVTCKNWMTNKPCNFDQSKCTFNQSKWCWWR